MRPPGDIRTALHQAFEQRAPCSWRAVLPLVGVDVRSPAEVRLVRWTVENMVRTGELVRGQGREKEAGSRVWRALYEPVGPDRGQAVRELEVVTRAWVPTF